ncbi:protein phosphatase 2C, putative [Bodo saltans]|uniref:protein-serine/threonine phosphatase n=1 Tax=Bodo saltans TaxID=75058 RepID=A0A0S4JKQ3_BODSA|nr:protein phosphatase 2C, putative [Bodo saltans]|eukprot:CUG90697.1 protein phosphatase 2C, putative [Bodo saltans]
MSISPRSSPRAAPVGRQRRSAVRYSNLEKATSSPILTKPNRTVLFDPSIVDSQMIGVVGAMQGWRKTMEDRHALVRIPSLTTAAGEGVSTGVGGALIAVFDGHRGIEAASIASHSIPYALLELIQAATKNRSDAPSMQEIFEQRNLEQVFIEVDATLRRSWEDQSLRSSRAASIENPLPPVFSEGSNTTTSTTSGDFVLSNPTSGQSSPQEFNASTLRAPPTLPNASDFSSITGTTAIIGIALPQGFAFINVGDSRSYLVQRRLPTAEQHATFIAQTLKKNDADDEDPSAESSVVSAPQAVVLPPGLTTKATSVDHRTTVASECARIEEAGGCVISGRVNGKLSVTRALGDFDLKPNLLDAAMNPVVCIPEVQFIERAAARESGPRFARRGTAQFSSTQTSDEGAADEAVDDHSSGVADESSPHLPMFTYDLIVVGCDGVWELQNIDAMAALVDEKLQAHSADLAGSNPSQVEHFGSLVETLLKDCVSEILVKCCASSCDPNGSSQGADNLSLGMLLLRTGH